MELGFLCFSLSNRYQGQLGISQKTNFETLCSPNCNTLF